MTRFCLRADPPRKARGFFPLEIGLGTIPGPGRTGTCRDHAEAPGKGRSGGAREAGRDEDARNKYADSLNQGTGVLSQVAPWESPGWTILPRLDANMGVLSDPTLTCVLSVISIFFPAEGSFFLLDLGLSGAKRRATGSAVWLLVLRPS